MEGFVFSSTLGTTLLFIFGTLLGSFLNVLAFRYDPDKFLFHKGVLRGRSHCMHCKRTLRWFELVPFVSFIVLRAKCRTCRGRISFQYPIVELIAGLLLAFVPGQVAGTLNRFLALDPTALLMLQIVWVVAFLALLLLSMIDLRTHLIPDELNVILVLCGIAGIFLATPSFGQVEGSFLGHYALLLGGRDNIWVNHLIGALIGAVFFGLIILLTRGKAMGLGDLKLATALGVLFGWPDVAAIIIFGFILGAIVGLGAILFGHRTMKSFVAFGPFLAVGSALVFFCGFSLARAYFTLLGAAG